MYTPLQGIPNLEDLGGGSRKMRVIRILVSSFIMACYVEASL